MPPANPQQRAVAGLQVVAQRVWAGHSSRDQDPSCAPLSNHPPTNNLALASTLAPLLQHPQIRNRLQQAAGGCLTESSLEQATSTSHGPPYGSQLWPAAGVWCIDDLYTEQAATLQQVVSCCGWLAHWKLTGADDIYIAWAAIWQQAMPGCWGVSHGKFAGADDPYTVLAATWQPAAADCWGVAHWI
jgi:hypothetical protein